MTNKAIKSRRLSKNRVRFKFRQNISQPRKQSPVSTIPITRVQYVRAVSLLSLRSSLAHPIPSLQATDCRLDVSSKFYESKVESDLVTLPVGIGRDSPLDIPVLINAQPDSSLAESFDDSLHFLRLAQTVEPLEITSRRKISKEREEVTRGKLEGEV